MAGGQRARAIGAVAALDDSVRSRLYAYVRRSGQAVTREQAADAVGISRKLAAFHLDKLVVAGLLRSGTLGSRARQVGRAPKVYEPVVDAVQVSVPARTHDELAAILIDAVVTQRPGENAADARRRVAAEQGRIAAGSVDRHEMRGRLGPERALTLVESVLDDRGYEPYRPGAGCIRLRNCPFHPLAERAPELVCGINEAFLGGLIDGLGADPLKAVFAPAAQECCVEVRRRS
ncbi:MAG: helix-turn-helix domain-containing protein [Propionibacteriales bacterium]|nr:helix-turn-helix domain-containing protein [Propionibacteriales bacterium]